MSGRTPDEGRYSKVSRRKWDDARFRKLSKAKPNAQTLWDRLLTGPELGCIPGLFAARQGGLADALEWPVAALRRCWLEIEAEGMAQADWSAGLVWVPNSIRHNEPQGVNVILGWRRALRELPECDLKRRAIEALGEHIARMGDSWAKAFAMATGKPTAMPSPMANAKPSDIQEQEQESGERNKRSPDAKDLTGSSAAPPAEAASTHAPEDPQANWDGSERETLCPADLVQRAIAVGVPRAVAQALRVDESQVLDSLREFTGYWTIGGGSGQARRHWMRKAREHVRKSAEQNKLKPPGAVEHEHRIAEPALSAEYLAGVSARLAKSREHAAMQEQETDHG